MGVVYGAGTCGKGKWLITNPDGSLTQERCLWKSMIERCYSEKYQKKKPSYIGCTVSDGFLDFQTFMLWAEQQVGFGVQGFRLDKDILIKGNKRYSEATCVFVPHQINSLLISRKADRGDCPIGVHWSDTHKAFVAQCSVKGRRAYLGMYKSQEAAFTAYKEYKQGVLRLLAEEYKGVIDVRAYEALKRYQVEITD